MENKLNQIFIKHITEVIKDRISIRSYKPEHISKEIKAKLTVFISELKGPFKSKVKFNIVDMEEVLESSNIKLGTYGIIKGASTFIIPSVEKTDNNMEELGYEFEKLILFATSLGLGTCWLAGTYKKGEFAKAINLKDNEILPSVSPIGYATEKTGIVASLMRLAAGSKNRKGWNEMFFSGNFDKNLTAEEAGKYSTPLEMVRLAPSASNKQPWRIVKDNNGYHFYLTHAKGYSSSLGFDVQKIDIGIAMCHFELTANEYALSGNWQIVDPKLEKTIDNTEYIISWITK